jgi:hypothetical protein
MPIFEVLWKTQYEMLTKVSVSKNYVINNLVKYS